MSELKILTYNVNGIRAAVKNGFLAWLKGKDFDIICLQEIKVAEVDFDAKPFEALGYTCYLFPAEKKGYSGVAIFTKVKPDRVVKGIALPEFDTEGRNIRIDVGDLSILSAYFPSGTTGDERQAVKMNYLEAMFHYLQDLRKTRPNFLICGDFNICHKEIDIHNPIQNKDTSGFKPEERAWMSKFFDSGFIDSFRSLHHEPNNYSWWSYRANARQNNKGWRIDYIAVTSSLSSGIKEAYMFPDAIHSDHCPVYCKIVY